MAGFCFLYTIKKTMPRALKQILYGLFYSGIFVAIAWVFIFPRFVEVATCTDGVQNQNEVGIDCGGLCEDCELKDLRLKSGGVEILGVGERSSLLVKVENPSKNFGALNVPYQFQITGLLGESVETIEGELNILENEEKYVAALGLNIEKKDIGGVIFSVGDFKFTPKADLFDYDVEIENVQTTFPEQVIEARGFALNDSGSALPEIILTALFYADDGDLVNVGTAILSNLGAFEKRDFVISVPRNDSFVDPDQTEISWRVI